MANFHNEHKAIKYCITFSLVDGHDGQIVEYTSHKDTVEQAIVEALIEHLGDKPESKMPLAGIAVYECVFTA